MTIAIVTDSTADIPSELVRQNQIHVMPNYIMIDGQSLKDGEGISREEFYQRLPYTSTLPTTGTASSGLYHELYEKLFNQGFSQILSIHAASALSGIFSAAASAAQAFGGRVKVIDSQQVSMGLGFQVLAAAEMVARGMAFDQIASFIGEMHKRVRLMAMLDTLEFVRRSGRVGWARASLGSLLRIKPFIELRDGIVESLGEVRTRNKGLERLIHLLTDLGPLERLAMLHTNSEGDARLILDSSHISLPVPPLIVNVTTIIGTHVGPNCVGFTAVLP